MVSLSGARVTPDDSPVVARPFRRAGCTVAMAFRNSYPPHTHTTITSSATQKRPSPHTQRTGPLSVQTNTTTAVTSRAHSGMSGVSFASRFL